MKSKSCPICSSIECKLLYKTKDYNSHSSNLFGVVKCKECGLIYVNPQPSEKELRKHYVSDYYGNYGRIFYKIFSFINTFLIRSRSRRILGNKKIKKGKILDIGCGDGSFLKYMKDKGWDVYGIETSKSGAKITIKKLKNKVYNSELQKTRFPKRYFDVITLWYVLEHVKDPDNLIKEVRRILKEGGSLVAAFQNIESIQAIIGKEKWFHLDVPRHLYHFSPKTLKKLLQKHNFKVERTNHFSFCYSLFGFLQTFLNILGLKFNFLYHLIKRDRQEKAVINFYFIYNLFLLILLTPFLLIPSVILTLVESFLDKGAIITFFCKKTS